MAYDHFELEEDARRELFAWNAERYQIALPNAAFSPPAGIWLKFDYIPAESIRISLNRKCRMVTGMVQVGVVFPPNAGTEKARRLAKEIAEYFDDGKIIGQGYVFTPGEIRPLNKSETGWFIPVRFAVRYLS